MDLARSATSSSPEPAAASAPPSPAASTPPAPASSSPTSLDAVAGRRRRSARAVGDHRRHLHRGRQRRADRRRRGGVRPDRPVLRQRRRRPSAPTSTTPEEDWAAGLRRQRQRPPLGGQAPARRLARPRRGLLLLDGVGGRAARPDRLGAVHASPSTPPWRSPSGCRSPTATAGVRVSCLCPQGVNTDMLAAAIARRRGRRGRAAAGAVLEPEEVADVVAEAIAEERFLILPHPEVARVHAAQGDDDPSAGWPGCAGCRRGSLAG